MIGIDIVDHSDPLLRPRDQRAFRLITHPADQHHLTSSFSISQLFWLYWAAKEAIYKCYRKPVRFDPKQIPVSIIESSHKIKIENDHISGWIEQDEKSTLCVCWHKSVTKEPWHQVYISTHKDQSAEIRSHLVNELAQKGIKAQMGTDWAGIPIIKHNGQQSLTTFTHHHRLMAFVCEAQCLE